MRIERVVAQQVVLDHVIDDVDTETVHSPVEPEPQDIEHCLLDSGIAPVQVGLFLEERVVVILARGLVELPRAAAEDAQPVIRWPAVWFRVDPDIPVALRVVTRTA